MKLSVTKLPITRFKEAYELQQRLFRKIYEENLDGNFLLLLEHPHVITLGRNAKANNLLASKEFLADKGVEVIETDRGGDITYHGPGQIVGYPILKLKDTGLDVKQYVTALEEMMINTCKAYGINNATRIQGLTGAWIGNRKIGSIGVRIQRWITLHGFAFNVNTDLDFFRLIIPCGIEGKEMTSLKQELSYNINMNEVKERMIQIFCDIFGCKVEKIEHNELPKASV